MKVLKIKTREKLDAYRKESCGKCNVVIKQGYYEVTCPKCIISKREVRVDITSKVDVDGDGHITKKEVNDYFNKKDDK